MAYGHVQREVSHRRFGNYIGFACVGQSLSKTDACPIYSLIFSIAFQITNPLALRPINKYHIWSEPARHIGSTVYSVIAGAPQMRGNFLIFYYFY